MGSTRDILLAAFKYRVILSMERRPFAVLVCTRMWLYFLWVTCLRYVPSWDTMCKVEYSCWYSTSNLCLLNWKVCEHMGMYVGSGLQDEASGTITSPDVRSPTSTTKEVQRGHWYHGRTPSPPTCEETK